MEIRMRRLGQAGADDVLLQSTRSPAPLVRRRPRLRFGLVFAVSLLVGCGSTTNPPTPPAPPAPRGPAVTWVENVEHEGVKISLGRRGETPVAAITRDGQPVANAMVFCTPLTGDSQPADDEVATIYESSADEDPPLYVASPWKRPSSGPALVRFRIVLPDAKQDFTRDIDIAK